jgi:hypothetical protein
VDDALLALIEEIHAAPAMLVYEFAGAGSEALAALHAVGGSSRTLLEAVDRYSLPSLVEAVGAEVVQAVSADVARALALHGRRRAAALAPLGTPFAGIGCTATIATDRAKRGEHRLAVAAATALGTHTLVATLEKGARDRAGEEAVVTAIVLRLVAAAKGVLRRVPSPLLEGEPLVETLEPDPLLAAFAAGERALVALDADGSLCPELPRPAGGIALVCGSFNPLHEGHLGLAHAASRHLRRPVAFELTLRNADKAPLELLEAYRRALQFPGRAPLVLTRAPLFSQKAALVPGAVFVIGADNAARVLETRFYDGLDALEASLAEVREHGASFLVAGRRSGERFVTLADLPIPERFGDLFDELPAEAFRNDVSSTAIREGWAA